MSARVTALGAASLLFIAATTHAQDQDGNAPSESATEQAQQAGMFLPFTDAPRTDSARAFVNMLGGYDGAREAPVLEGRAEVTVYGPIAVRDGVQYADQPEERLRPNVGARVQALNQGDHAIDMSIGLFYKPEGFTEGEGEIEAVVALGRSFGRTSLFGDLAYGQDPEGNERDGEARLAILYLVAERFSIGLDSRARFDLGTGEEKLEEEGGVEFDFSAGPGVSYQVGEVAVGAHGGLSVLETEIDTKLGPLAMLTLSGAL